MASCNSCNHINPDDAASCARCGEAFANEALSPGAEIGSGRYRIDAILGEGGMGTVYKATDLSLGRVVALKLLNPELTSHATARRRMEQEARILAAIEHPNVVQVRNVFSEGEILAMELEFMAGGDLLDRIPTGGMPEAEAVRVMASVLSGLEAIHRAGLVHRDIKPDNVLLSADGVPKVTDFGVARDPNAREKTRVGATLGTAEYMSPEQIQGQSVDQRSDLYSAGIVLYRMLTGDLPFTATTEFEWQAAHVQQEPNLDLLRAKASAGVCSVVEKALLKQQDERWQTAAEMADALSGRDEVVAPAPARTPPQAMPNVSSAPPSSASVPEPASTLAAAKSNKGLYAGLGGVALVAIVGAILAFGGGGSGNGASGSAPALAPADGEPVAQGVPTTIDPSPDAAVSIQPLLNALAQTHAMPGATPKSALAGEFQPGQSVETVVELLPGKCYTAVAASLPPVREVDVRLVSHSETRPVLAQDNDTGGQAVLGKKPNCFKWALPLAAPATLVMTVRQGAGFAGVQLYEHEESAGRMSEPADFALPCKNDEPCMTHRCNTAVGRCAWPCQTDFDCQPENRCETPQCVPR